MSRYAIGSVDGGVARLPRTGRSARFERVEEAAGEARRRWLKQQHRPWAVVDRSNGRVVYTTSPAVRIGDLAQ